MLLLGMSKPIQLALSTGSQRTDFSAVSSDMFWMRLTISMKRTLSMKQAAQFLACFREMPSGPCAQVGIVAGLGRCPRSTVV